MSKISNKVKSKEKRSEKRRKKVLNTYIPARSQANRRADPHESYVKCDQNFCRAAPSHTTTAVLRFIPVQGSRGWSNLVAVGAYIDFRRMPAHVSRFDPAAPYIYKYLRKFEVPYPLVLQPLSKYI